MRTREKSRVCFFQIRVLVLCMDEDEAPRYKTTYERGEENLPIWQHQTRVGFKTREFGANASFIVRVKITLVNFEGRGESLVGSSGIH